MIQATKLRNRTAVTTAKVPKNHLMMRAEAWRRRRGKSICPRPAAALPRPVRPDAAHEALHHGGREVELRHLVAPAADDLRDLVVRRLVLPFGAGEVGGAHHRPLRPVAGAARAVAGGAV